MSQADRPAGDDLRAVSRERFAVVQRICEAFQISALQPQLRACEEVFRNRGIVDIAVMGQFKAGKSSFLNSLMGEEVLPVDVLPATAVVTRIGYGETEGAECRLLTGEIRECTLGELTGYVTEGGNPGNVKQVERVEVRLPALACFPGIRFVDTPGLGSVFLHNTQASLDWLPRVGGALLAIGVNQPFGEQDLRLLTEVARHTPEIAILLTKADLVSEGQLATILEFTQHQVAQCTGRQLPILPYSTQPGWGHLRERLREHVLRDLAGRHQDLFSTILEHKILALRGACRGYLHLALRAAESAAEARSALSRLLEEEQGSLQSVTSEMGVLTRELQARARSSASDHFQAFRGEAAQRLRASLRKDLPDWKGNLAQRRARFEQWLELAMREEMARVSAQGPDFLAAHLTEAQASLQRGVRGFQDRLARAIEQALGLTFDGARFHAELPEPRHPDVRIGRTFDTQLDLLWFLLPMGLLAPLFERYFLGLIPWEAEKNLFRLSNQWAEAAEAAIDLLASQATVFMRQELLTLEALTAMAQDRRDEIQRALDRLGGISGEAQ